MTSYTQDVWKQVSDLTMHNKKILNSSKLAGCYYCLKVYPATAVDEFVDSDDETGLCPECGIDAVVGDATGYPVTDAEFLQSMHNHGFIPKHTIDETIQHQQAS